MRQFIHILLFGVAVQLLAAAATPTPVQLGVNYSEWLGFTTDSNPRVATDNTGAVYLLTTTLQSNVASSIVTKLSPDGKTIVWQNPLGFAVSTFTVDPTGGGVYVVPVRQQSDTSGFVVKLSPSGTGFAWKTPVGLLPQSINAIAADAQGRVTVAGLSSLNDFLTQTAYVSRLNASGSALDFTTPITGTPISLALDPATGAAYIAGSANDSHGAGISFLAKVNADGTAGYDTSFPAGVSQTVAVDANGNVVLFGSGTIQRVDANGAATLKTPVSGPTVAYALDAAGNAYVLAVTNNLYPVKNSLAPCRVGTASTGSASYNQLLSIIAPDGSLIQATYLPGGDNLGSPRIAVSSNGAISIVATSGPSFTPTQTGPFAAGIAGSFYLLSLSSTASSSSPAAMTYPLACAGNSASFGISAISPGELVTLFGSGLGPQQGVATVPNSANNLYPTAVSNVQVTFDGAPAPLLWVQDSQINLVAPWSLTPGQNTRLCVSYNNTSTNCLTWPVVQASPGVFTLDGRYAAALNQDGSYNSASNPAAPGTIVSIFATGLGPITPLPPDGSLIGFPLPTNTLPVGVDAFFTIGIPVGTQFDMPFDVQYAGPAPTLVAGVSQINFRVASFPSYGSISVRVNGTVLSPGFSIYIAGQ